MKNIIRNQNARNSISNIVDAIFLPIAALLVTPIFIHYLGINEFGLWMLINSVIASLSMFNVGGSNVMIKYVSAYRKANNQIKINQIFSSLFVFQIILGAVIFLIALVAANILIHYQIFEINKNNSDLFKTSIYIGTGIFVIKLLEQVITGYFKGYEKYDTASIFSVTSKLFILITQIITVIYGGNLLNIFTNSLLILCVLFILQLLGLKYIYRSIKFISSFKWSTLAEMLAFSWWSWLLSATMTIVSQLDRWIIGALAGLEILGYYSIAYMIMNHIHMILSSSVAWTFPKVSKEGISDSTIKLFYSAHSFVVISSTIASIILLNFQNLFVAWLGSATYYESSNLIKLILVVTPIYSLSILPFFYANGSGNIKYNFYNSLITGIMRIFLMLLFYNAFHVEGIIYALGLSSMIMSIHYYWTIKYKAPIPKLSISYYLLPVTIYTFITFIITSHIITDGKIIAVFYLSIFLIFLFAYKKYFNIAIIAKK